LGNIPLWIFKNHASHGRLKMAVAGMPDVCLFHALLVFDGMIFMRTIIPRQSAKETL
jgi:hypothetical protein